MGFALTIWSLLSLSAPGIRRLPGSDMDVEHMKVALKNQRSPSDILVMLQSMMQGSSLSKWSNISTELNTVIGELTTELYEVIETENQNAQTGVYKQLNEYKYWIELRKEAETHAQSAEEVLASAVATEQAAAEKFHAAEQGWRTQMKRVYPLCKLQQDKVDVDIIVNPQSTFSCNFDVVEANTPGNCQEEFDSFETNVTNETATMKTDLDGQLALYEIAKKDCNDSIDESNKQLLNTTTTHETWRQAREIVSTKYEIRKQIVCGINGATSVLDDDCFYECVMVAGSMSGTCREGLDLFAQSECSSGLTIANTQRGIEAVNVSTSLDDRNYEVDSLNIVECLLSKLTDFVDGSFNDDMVSDIVDDCKNTAEPKWVPLVMNYKTSTDESFPTVFSASPDGCEPADAHALNIELTTCNSDSMCDEAEAGTVTVGYTEIGNSITQYSKYGLGIPAKYSGSVTTHDVWVAESTASKTICDKYFCPDSDANGDPIPCFDDVARTNMVCSNTVAGDDATLYTGNLVELEGEKTVVPTTYVNTDSETQGTVSTGSLKGCE